MMLSSSGFVDYVMFSHDGTNRTKIRQRCFVELARGETGTEVVDSLRFYDRLNTKGGHLNHVLQSMTLKKLNLTQQMQTYTDSASTKVTLLLVCFYCLVTLRQRL